MEQRSEPRLVADQPVVVTVLGDDRCRHAGTVKNVSGRGLGLEVPGPIKPGSAVTIELDDSILLGEAVYCRVTENSCFVGVELEQALRGLAELGRATLEFKQQLQEGRERTP